jgi:hypothetical protein
MAKVSTIAQIPAVAPAAITVVVELLLLLFDVGWSTVAEDGLGPPTLGLVVSSSVLGAMVG